MKKNCIQCHKIIYNNHKEPTRCKTCFYKDLSRMLKGKESAMKGKKQSQKARKKMSQAKKLYYKTHRSINYKNGRIDQDGYKLVWCSNHPNYPNKNYVYEHRLIMEKHLGRYLKPKEIVHHINGIRDDNRLRNLKLTTPNKHEHNTLLKIAQQQIRKLERKIERLEAKLNAH